MNFNVQNINDQLSSLVLDIPMLANKIQQQPGGQFDPSVVMSNVFNGGLIPNIMEKIQNMTSNGGNLDLSSLVLQMFESSAVRIPSVRCLDANKHCKVKHPDSLSFLKEDYFDFVLKKPGEETGKAYSLPKAVSNVLPAFSFVNDFESESHNDMLFECEYDFNEQIVNELWGMALGVDERNVVALIKDFDELISVIKFMQYFSFELNAIKNVCLAYLSTEGIADFYEAYSRRENHIAWFIALSHFPSEMYQKIFQTKDFDIFEDTPDSRSVLENIITRYLHQEDFVIRNPLFRSSPEEPSDIAKPLAKVVDFFGVQVHRVFVDDKYLYFGKRRYAFHNSESYMWTLVTALIDYMVGGDNSDQSYVYVDLDSSLDTNKPRTVDIAKVFATGMANYMLEPCQLDVPIKDFGFETEDSETLEDSS